MLRLLPLLVLGALLVPATAQASSGDPRFPDISLAQSLRLSALATWGGEYTVSDGYKVHVETSDVYPVDDAANQRVADFLDSALHGPEIQTVTIVRVSPSEITQDCGSADALACYSPDMKTIVTPVEPATADFTPQAALLHEYGHHVANSRRNPPFNSVDYGPKRWATYENVCAQTQRGNFHPGAESFPEYTLNPGEGWAEAYRVVNEARLGLTQEDIVVSSRFQPNAKAASLVTQDVVSPWKQGPSSMLTGRLAAGRSRTYRVSTPLDGNFSVRGPAGLRLSLLGAIKTKAAPRSASGWVCGKRSVQVRVTAKRALRYRLTVTKP
jgi:hypothetical protein